MASSLTPSSSTQKWKYDVFLSFRGEDTRNNFTDHLYAAFSRKSIVTFRDEEGLERGKPISKLLKAIEVSQFAIIIFSKNYASSTWCLDELAKIVKCREETGLIILPVFYDVDPSDVRKQTATFKQAFIDHQKCFEDNIEKVETWRAALREVADISGWHLQNRHEFEFIQCIVKEMMEKLSSKSSSITKNFVGMESTVEEMIHLYLGFENNVYMIGIYGMGGLGKTTLARVVYDKFCGHFEGSSFIANIREDSKKHGLPRLQKQLLADILGDKKNIDICNVYEGVDMIKKSLCHKKVLLVIDDVNQLDQLEKLVGEKNWFGLGSWIIITTRDEHVLVQHGVLERYKPKVLYNDDASKLFCLKAFKMEQPKEGYEQLSQKVVEYANGLPLALVTLGSFLVGSTIDEWQSALNSFKKTKGEIFDILKISYDGLEEMWKEVFLDIACFFRGRNKDQVIEILENCGFDARIGISVLMEKSLLTTDDGERLWMHDLLQEMGEKIIRLKSDGNLGKQSRLWLNEDLIYVLENDMATEAIQAIVVKGRKEDFNLEEISEGFSKMSNLRLLEIDAMNSLNDQRHLALPNNLRYLWWKCCPFKCLASSHKRMAFVQLDLQHSKFEYLWEGVMGLLCRKAVLDGSIIPSCLAEIEGNSISIELPSNWYNSKWIGFALWASLPLGGNHMMALGDMPQNHCASKLLNIPIYVDVNNELDDSICLLYLSRDDWFAKVGNGECSQIKVIFDTDESSKGIRGKCGVSLIYKQDVDEFNETNAQCLIKSFGEVSIYKLIAGDDDDDDVHIVDDDDDDVYIVGDDDDDVLIVGDDDFDDDDI